MSIKFDPEWLMWDTDKKEIVKLFKKKVNSPLTQGAQNKLNGLLELRKKRSASKIFLTFFNQDNLTAALWRATTRFRSSPDANLLLSDVFGNEKTITIDQGTHQEEDSREGEGFGYMLHFDARSSRNGKCFHIYVGQMASGAVTVTSIAYSPTPGKFVVALPDSAEV